MVWFVEPIEVGPWFNESWLVSRVDGHEWKLRRIQGKRSRQTTRFDYDVIIFDNNGRPIHHEVASHDTDDIAIQWAKSVFVSVMIERGYLPKGGVFVAND